MKKKIAKLIDVKSIMTLSLTGVFVFMSLENRINSQEFMTIYTILVGFYFGTQYEKMKEPYE